MTPAGRQCCSRAVPPVGAQAAPLLSWCIAGSSTDLSCHHHKQSHQLQLSQADCLLQFSLLALASGKEQHYDTNTNSLFSPRRLKRRHSRVLRCCWIFLLLHGLVSSSMSGKQNLRGSQAKFYLITQHGFKRSY